MIASLLANVSSAMMAAALIGAAIIVGAVCLDQNLARQRRKALDEDMRHLFAGEY